MQRDIEKFIAENVGMNMSEIKEDMDFYNEILNKLEEKTIREGSKLLDRQNRLSLLSMVVYSIKKDADLDEWLAYYAQNNSEYFADQEKNFLHMKADFERFIGIRYAEAVAQIE